MRLLDTTTLKLKFFVSEVPPYAILSHRWETEELTFRDVESEAAQHMRGYQKIVRAAAEAKAIGHGYIWVDTCCIDQSSSAELSEAINSMYRWYKEADKCIVYLADVQDKEDLPKSLWFTRGWTLQELIAPRDVVFLNADWKPLGTKMSLLWRLHELTSILPDALLGNDLESMPACTKMSWASKRRTTRPEDMAYCLLGLFNVNMPLLYGEGQKKAFMRLQEEFLRQSDDESIFAWLAPSEEAHSRDYWGLLAPSPSFFAKASRYKMPRFKAYRQGRAAESTNNGISMSLILHPHPEDETGTLFVAKLNCNYETDDDNGWGTQFAITLQKLSDFENQYARVRPDIVINLDADNSEPSTEAGAEAEAEAEAEADGAHLDGQIEQIYVRSVPRKSQAAAGFRLETPQKMPFVFVSNSIKGPIDRPGELTITQAITQEMDEASSLERNPVVKIRRFEAMEAMQVGPEFDVEFLRQKKVVKCVQLFLHSSLHSSPAKMTRIKNSPHYKHPYLIVGFEPLQANALGTKPGFVAPWYSFSDVGDEDITPTDLASSCESPTLVHRAPGGYYIRVELAPGTFGFGTYYNIKFLISKENAF